MELKQACSRVEKHIFARYINDVGGRTNIPPVMWCKFGAAADDDETVDDGTQDIWINRLESYNRDLKILIPKPLGLLSVISVIAQLLKRAAVEAERGDASLDITKAKKRKGAGTSYTAVHKTKKANCTQALEIMCSFI